MTKKITVAVTFLLCCAFAACGRSPEKARKELAALDIEYSIPSFVQTIKKRDEVAVKLFLESGIDVNGNNGAPLIAAVQAGSEPLVRELLRRGAKAASSDSRRYGPIEHAAEAGNLPIIKLFVEYGVEIHPLFLLRRGGYENAFDVAEKNGRTEIVDYLIKRCPVSQDEANRALLLAVLANEPRLIKRCVKLGADLNYRSEAGDTALSVAEKLKHEESLECLRELGVKKSDSGDVVAETASQASAESSSAKERPTN